MSLGWQRHASFDQIPGFSSLSTKDNLSSSGSSIRPSSKPLSSKGSSSRPTSGRARHLGMATPDLTKYELNKTMPFLDEANPSQFFDILKGVSARLDESAGVSKKDAFSPLRSMKTSKTRKRARPASLGSTSDAKRGRVGSLKATEGDSSRITEKGKGKALSAEVESPSEISFLSTGYSRDDSSMDVEESRGVVSATYSQAEMPPPPAPPTKHPGPIKEGLPPAEFKVTPRALQHESFSRDHGRIDSKPRKPAPVPKLHPLLLQPQAPQALSSNSQTSILSPKPQLPLSNRPPDNRTIISQTAPFHDTTRPSGPPSSNPGPISSQSRLPALGMRRTNTFPSRSTAISTSGGLPTRQKGFKPPLLSSSQQQNTIKEERFISKVPPLEVNGNKFRNQQSVASVKQETIAKTMPLHAAADREAKIYMRAPAGSNGSSTSSDSHSLGSSTSSRYTSPPRIELRSANASQACAQVHAPPVSPVLPEPSDTDPDSSFGDMSFDLDALEETMRMYD